MPSPLQHDATIKVNRMRRASLIAAGFAVLLFAAFAWMQWLEAGSAAALLESVRRVRPHSTLAEVTQALGPANYTFEAPDFPPWLRASSIGNAKRGTALVYTINRFHPKLLIIHLLPESGVQFVTWEPT